MDCVQAQLAAKRPVVPALRLFEPGQVAVEVLLGLESGAVDALQHRTFLVASPVSASDAEELEGRNFPGVVYVGSLAKIDEAIVPVDGEGRGFVQAFYQLKLIGLFRKELLGLVPIQFLPDEGEAARDAFFHQGLDAFQVFRGEGTGDVEVVVEPVLGGRSDAHLGFRKQLQHRVGHDVSG